MLVLPLVWLALFVIVLGWGLLVITALRRFGGTAFYGVLSAFQTMWLGYAALLAFCQLVSLLLPIAEPVLGLSLVPALAGFAFRRRDVARWILAWKQRPRVAAVAGFAIAATSLAVADAAANWVNWYDTGLYHISSVSWMTSYPAVPGLANLHLRHGYNNSIHVFAAYTDVFWEGASSHIANGFLLTTVLSNWIVEGLTARSPRGRVRQVFCLLTIPFLLAKVWTIEVPSLSSDLALALVCLVLVLELLSLPRRGPLALVVVVSLAAVALTTKLGGLAPCAVVVVFALLEMRRRTPWRVRGLVFALPALVVLGWMLRGIVTSGWLMFPVFGKLPLAWAVRSRVAAAHLAEIQHWGRGQPVAPGFIAWFQPWFGSELRGSHALALAFVSMTGLAWRIVTGPIGVRASVFWAAFAASALGLVQWFWGAPAMRYGAFWFWIVAAAVFTPLLVRAMRDVTMRVFMLVLSCGLSYWSGGFAIDLITPPLFGRPPDPTPAPTITEPDGSMRPATGDQCWNGPLMCTPMAGKIRWREPNNPRAGFLPR